MEEKNFFKEIVEEILNEEGIEWKKLSFGWLYKVQKDDKIKYIKQNMFSINEIVPFQIASDKYATFEILRENNVNTIEYSMIFNPDKRYSYIDTNISEKIINCFNMYNKKVVVKPNDGNSGYHVYKCTNIKEIENAIQIIFKDRYSLSICPYYDIEAEYRVVYLSGECLLVFGKYKPVVIGNGKDTVEKLMKYTKMDDFIKNIPYKKLKYVPKYNEKFEISWKHNLCEGARIKIVEDEILKERIMNLAKQAANAIDIDFATIDIAHIADSDELKVLEINSTVCLDKFKDQVQGGMEIVKNIYKKAINKMFE